MTFAQVIAPLPVWAFFGGLLLAVNLLAFALFGIDKARARRGDWRISEATLLAVAFLGAYPGAKLGQRHFRHKTRKQPFAHSLDTIGILQILLAGALAIPVSRALMLQGAASAWAWALTR